MHNIRTQSPVLHILLKATSVFLAVLTMGILLTVGIGNISAQSPRFIDNDELNYYVDLGDRIEIFISADIEKQVDEVKAIITPRGNETISSYRYPTFTQDGHIHASLIIDVNSPAYYPQGIVFDIYFDFTASDGTVHRTKTYQIENLDERHSWRRAVDDNLEVIYYGIFPNSINRLHSQTTDRLPRIKAALGVTDQSPMRAVIFPTLDALTKHGPTISGAAKDGNFFGGYAYPRYNLTIMASPSDSVLTHELTHIIFDKAFTSPLSSAAPAWLNEGVASYFETGSRRASKSYFTSTMRPDRVMTFRKMNTVPGRRNDISLFYAQSGDFVGFLAERNGEQAIGQLIAKMNDGSDVDIALRSVYGAGLNQLENEWRTSYGLPLVPEPAPTETHPFGELPPTIPGLPTIDPEHGIVVSDTPSVPTPRTASAPAPSPAPQPESTPSIESSEASPTPQGYFTGPRSGEFPTTNPTMVLIFGLLALGFGAMLWRRMRQ